ncbi:MAG: PhzF family phenazine biosynthesis protein [Nocardioidaceae bacterium]
MRLHYDIVDVFTDRPFAGNQLAVVHGGDDLTAEQCLTLAREFNFSEITFPSSAVTDGTEYATRIFTPGGEIPFAGHPTLGTAWVLRSQGLLTSAEATQVCGAGRIGVRFAEGDSVELSAVPRVLVGPLERPLVNAMLSDLGLTVADLAGEVWAAGCGLTFVHLPVTEEAVVRARPSSRPVSGYAERVGGTQDPIEGLNLVAVSGEAPSLRVHARVFVPGLLVPEDPATGSAAAGLGMALVASGLLPEGGRYDISQGHEMGRPSTLHGRVTAESGTVSLCQVSGQVQHVGTGEIAVP